MPEVWHLLTFLQHVQKTQERKEHRLTRNCMQVVTTSLLPGHVSSAHASPPQSSPTTKQCVIVYLPPQCVTSQRHLYILCPMRHSTLVHPHPQFTRPNHPATHPSAPHATGVVMAAILIVPTALSFLKPHFPFSNSPKHLQNTCQSPETHAHLPPFRKTGAVPLCSAPTQPLASKHTQLNTHIVGRAAASATR